MPTYRELDAKNPQDTEDIRSLVTTDISEPYLIYVYRFFLNQWPQLSILAIEDGKTVGAVVGKLEPHRNVRSRGYIGILVVDKKHRRKGIAQELVKRVIRQMIEQGADEIMLETEVVNKAALKLYKHMGFLVVKRLHRYYLNQHDAVRLVLPVTDRSAMRSEFLTPL